MELQFFVIKIPVTGQLGIDPEKVVDVFHEWVAGQTMPEILVDVAELLHVHHGPGVIAVGHEADYALDHTGGQWGLLYRRKDAPAGDNASRLAQAFHAACHAARLLEERFGDALEFSRTTFTITVNDRLLAPNTSEFAEKATPVFRELLAGLLGHEDFQLATDTADPRRRFSLTVTSGKPVDFAEPAHVGA